MPKVTFTPPKGYAAPEGVGPGDTFQELCEFRMDKGGVTLTKMGDVPMEADGMKQGKPDYSDEAVNMANAMSQPQQETADTT